jgi:hypothetical protein
LQSQLQSQSQSQSQLQLQLRLRLIFWLSSPKGICVCLFPDHRQKPRHPDRSHSQSHREWRSGGIPAFRFCFCQPYCATRHGEVVVHPLNSFVAHSVDLSV